MSPLPLSPSTVHTVLQYISPPSQLDRPLPPYLVSKTLLQRHHFLQITPDNPAEYLCWPSSTSAAAIDILECLPPPADDVPPSYSVHYTSDAEHTCAHAALPPAGPGGEVARLVFQWDQEDGWKFHDTKLMPFPPGSRPSLRDVLGPASSEVDTTTTTTINDPAPASQPYNSYGFANDDDGSDDDDYWNAYGASDINDSSLGQQLAKESVNDSEDAYWARYSSVHGTADSTIPSPPVQRRKVHPYADTNLVSDSPHPIPVPPRLDSVDTPAEVLHIPSTLDARLNSRFDPASPHLLSHLLSKISPRLSPSECPAFVPDLESEPDLSPPRDGSEESDTPSPPDVLGLYSGPALLQTSQSEKSHGLDISAVDGPVVAEEDEEDEEEMALKQGLKGLYALWNMSRVRKGILPDDQAKTAFVRIVQDVVGLDDEP